MASPALTSRQLHALFEILTHAQTYDEVETFKFPGACSDFGHPFVKPGPDGRPHHAPRSATPILHSLLAKFVLSLPPAHDIPPEFWSVRLQGLLTKFAEAELSESYDMGALGARKTLATASAAVIATASRGCLGGCPGGPVEDLGDVRYNTENARHLFRAWNHVTRGLVYGDLVGELFDRFTETEAFEDHSSAVNATVELIIVQYVPSLPFEAVLRKLTNCPQLGRLPISDPRSIPRG